MELNNVDESQARALSAAVAPCRLSIIGAPGTGKTFLLSSLVQREVAVARSAPRIAVLTQDRRAATLLRNQISRALGGMPETIKVQTLTAFCYALVQGYAHAVNRSDPELISGPDEDSILGEILAASPELEFPSFVDDEVRRLSSFREEIRNLITRAAELGYSAEDLDGLSREYAEPMWHAGAQVMEAYESVTVARAAYAGTSDAADMLDHAQLVGMAASMLAGWERSVAAAPSADTLQVPRPRWDWVLVDDLQNAPRSILALLSELASDGASIVVAGDPDAAVQGFRGGVASLPGDVTAPAPTGLGCTPVFLTQRHRGGTAIADLSDRLVQRIRVGGRVTGHRLPQERAAGGAVADEVSAHRYVHREEEVTAIARTLRLRHFRDGVPYDQMAIVTRSRSDHGPLRGSLIRKSIPVEQIGSDRPLREHPAVSGLIDVIRLGLRSSGEQDLPSLVSVLTSCIVGIDPLELRRIGRVMRGYEVVSDGNRSESDLLSLALNGPDAVRAHAPQGAERLCHAATIFEHVRVAAGTHGQLAEEVLWAAWDASGMAEVWRRQALSGGLAGDWADIALDSVIQLFRVAQRMADRDSSTTIALFIAEVMNQDLPEDSIARLGASQDAVTLTTPSASQGREWDVVVIAGLQDGTWPNMRIRDTYTHTARLTQIATGRLVPGLSEREQRFQDVEETLDDELRQLYHALGRARKQLILTCVDSDDSAPSRFFEAMDFVKEEEAEEGEAAAHSRILQSVCAQSADLDMPGLIGQLRRAGATESAEAAKQLLEELEDAGVPGAQPLMWFDQLSAPEDSSGGGAVSVSPSRVEKLLECPLQGFLQGVGAESAEGQEAASLGTFIHALAEELPHGSLSEYIALMDERWYAEFGDPEEGFSAAKLHRRARSMVETLAEYVKDHPEPVKPEERVHLDVDANTALNASLDRVTLTDAGARVADFKTGKTVPTKSAAADHIQMQIYQWIVEKTYGASDGAELVYLGKAMGDGSPDFREQAPLDAAGRERAESRINEAANILRAAGFPARPEENVCKRCSFKTVCPAKSEGRMFS
ncbi:MAG: ATP-dependent helicase [Ancrocorticia sp.]|uniref:ATP-dependent helicase n=1 Tax=Ancrocorticia sp. TaxID=2593684 RepID=UPI003F935C35